jgi:hypothetical protein
MIIRHNGRLHSLYSILLITLSWQVVVLVLVLVDHILVEVVAVLVD